MINLTVRTKKKFIQEIDQLASIKGVDRAQIIREILERGLEKEKIKVAIELYQEGNSLERAANLANVNIWDVLDAIYSLGIPKKIDLKQEKLFFAQAFEKELPEVSKKILEL